MVFGDGCADALRSQYAMLLGVPTAAWGMLFYTGLAVHLVVRRSRHPRPEHPAGSFALLAVTAASLMALFMVGMMLSGNAPLCAFCLMTHAGTLTLWFVLRFSVGLRTMDAVMSWWETLRATVFVSDRLSELHKHRLINLALSVLVGLVVYQWAYAMEKRIQLFLAEPDPVALLAQLESQPPEEIRIHENDAVLGDSLAGVHAVLFSDFSCPSCRALADELQRLHSLFGQHVRLVFKHFPLDAECNHLITENVHPGSCLASRAAIAAHKQGAFWAYHDSLFQRQWEIDDGQLFRIAASLKLDSSRFVEDLHANSTEEQIRRDILEGERLKIRGTPALFINGRQVLDTRPRTIHVLLEHLEISYRRFYQKLHPEHLEG